MTEVIERDATRAPVKSDTPPEPKAPRLLDQLRERIRVLHYSRSTESTYLHWIKAYIHFHGLRHPRDMGAAEVEAYLSHLATARDVAAGTQNQAMHAWQPDTPESRFAENDLRAKVAGQALDKGMDAASMLGHSTDAVTRRHYIRGTRKVLPLG